MGALFVIASGIRGSFTIAENRYLISFTQQERFGEWPITIWTSVYLRPPR